MTARSRSHRLTNARCKAVSSLSTRSMASRDQSRRSVATWSLRLRPVCSFRPTSPRRSISACSTCMWMSSSSCRNGSSPRSSNNADLDQGLFDLLTLVPGQQADLGQHLRVRDRAGDVVRVQPVIEADALGERFDPSVGGIVEHATAGRTRHAA